jgi:hypothetical protein
MSNIIGWGQGATNNSIGWGQSGNNSIGFGSVYATSNAGETDLGIIEPSTYFGIVVDTSITGTGTVSNTDQFQFTGAVGDYDVEAYQNGILVATFENLSGQQTITLPSSGVYELRVEPKEANGFNRIRFNNGGDRSKVNEILGFGTNVVWNSLELAFLGCNNLTKINGIIYNAENIISPLNQSFANCGFSEIPKDLFVNFTNGGLRNTSFTFRNNSNLEIIPKGLFDKLKNTLTFRNVFQSTGVKVLPVGLFNESIECINFTDTFASCTLEVESLSRLYIELFQNNLNENVPFHGGSGKFDPNFTLNGITTQQAIDGLVARNWALTDGGAI